MRISINQHEREIALLALDFADKACDATRKGLELLRQEHLGVMALQGRISELRSALKSEKDGVHDWSFDERAAMATALHVYRGKLQVLSRSEGTLLADSSPTEERIGDVRSFISRLVDGQETLWQEPEVLDAQAEVSAADWTTTRATAIPAPIASRLALPEDAPRADAVRALEAIAGLLERGPETVYAEVAFTELARGVLRLLAPIVPDFNGTYAGAYLLQEVIYEEVNVMILAAWLRQQLELVRPPKLSAEAVSQIRMSLDKDPLDEDAPAPATSDREVAVLAENTARNPIDVRCRHCGAGATTPCRSFAGKIVASAAHAERMRDVDMWGDARRIEVGNALYMDAVLVNTFGRVDDQLRDAARRRRTIDLNARWVQGLLAEQLSTSEARA